ADGDMGHGPAALRSRLADADPAGASPRQAASPAETMARVAASLGRRPQTVRQLSVALGLSEDDISRAVKTLVHEKKIQARAELDHVFYQG
ncbi:MAG: hypothetical protein V3572_03425, partial [Desulfolutivibrio sp.]